MPEDLTPETIEKLKDWASRPLVTTLATTSWHQCQTISISENNIDHFKLATP
jgi:hypothetical protein